MKQQYLYILLAFTVILASCQRHPSKQLQEIAPLCSEAPDNALIRLNTIDLNALSDYDSNYHHLLTVKAMDKAYIYHTSDSLITAAIDYFSHHGHDSIYSEALYYGGRVYSDLGDKHTALKYYQKSLDRLPVDTKQQDLRGRVLTQTACLLTDLHLWDEAIPYIKQSLDIDTNINDTVGAVYDLNLLATTNIALKKYKAAEESLNKALFLSQTLPVAFTAKTKVNLAQLKSRQGDIDKALNLIRNTPDQVNAPGKGAALAIASQIYLRANILDTAYTYATHLISSQDPDNKDAGYYVLLSPKLQKFIPIDSLYNWIYDYKILLDSVYNKNTQNLAIDQQALYNYRLHEKAKQQAQRDNDRLKTILGLTLLLAFVLIIVVLIIKIRNRNQLLQLRLALDTINRLSEKISITQNQPISHEEADTTHQTSHTTQGFNIARNKEILRDRLRDKLLELYEENKDNLNIPAEIIASQAYTQIQSLIKNRESISASSPLLNDLEKIILKVSPDFKSNLEILLGYNIASYDYHTAILIKCGITPTQMSVLFNRAKGTISSRRQSLSFRIFDKKVRADIIDAIIRLI